MRRCALLLLFSITGLATACGDGGTSGPPGQGGAGGGSVQGSTGGAPTGGPPAPQRYFLRIDDQPVPPVDLDLDRKTALQLFGDAGARRIVALRVDPTNLLGNALAMIRGACGSGYLLDKPDPGYDCQATPLGQTFGPGWATSPEFAFVRLLGMTPANANVAGTSLSDLATLFHQNAAFFAVDFAQVLSQSLGIDRTSPFLPTAPLVAALKQQLIATHPAVHDPSGTLPVTLDDALHDLTPLATELGPVGAAPWSGPGEHPGILVPDDATFTTRSDALGPAFRMRIRATSNLRLVQGVDLAKGAGSLFVADGAAPLSFDFNDPNRFAVTGIADSPTMDLRFSIKEKIGGVPACTGSPCKTNLPPPLGVPVGPNSVWAIPPFFFQAIVARAGLDAYGSRSFDTCYLKLKQNCLVGVSIGSNGDPAGWTAFTNQVQGVNVPAPQFLWELLDEVAQEAAHDPQGAGVAVIPPGDAPVFRLTGVPIGLTGQEIVAAMRPSLQSQAATIADFAVGGYWKNSDDLDFYYRRPPEGGPPYLYFVGPADLRPDPDKPGVPAPYTYDNPGFFSSPELAPSSKVSSKSVSGLADTQHEKYLLPKGTTVLYVEDARRVVHELRFDVGDDPRVITVETKSL